MSTLWFCIYPPKFCNNLNHLLITQYVYCMALWILMVQLCVQTRKTFSNKIIGSFWCLIWLIMNPKLCNLHKNVKLGYSGRVFFTLGETSFQSLEDGRQRKQNNYLDLKKQARNLRRCALKAGKTSIHKTENLAHLTFSMRKAECGISQNYAIFE